MMVVAEQPQVWGLGPTKITEAVDASTCRAHSAHFPSASTNVLLAVPALSARKGNEALVRGRKRMNYMELATPDE